MNISKLSSKYQIVIPKVLRDGMKLKKGMSIVLYPLDGERAILVKHPANYTKALEGLGKEVWRSLGGSAKYMKQERASWGKR